MENNQSLKDILNYFNVPPEMIRTVLAIVDTDYVPRKERKVTALTDGADSVDRLLLDFAKELRFIDSQRLNLLISKQEEARLRTVVHQNTKTAIHQYISDGIPQERTAVLSADGPGVAKAYMNGFNMCRQQIRNNLGLKKGD